MDKILHDVGELSIPERSAVEGLIGHSLRDDQRFYIVALEAGDERTAAKRQAAWNELQVIVGEAHENARQSGATAQEVERTIDEECDDVRYGK